jgi:transposase
MKQYVGLDVSLEQTAVCIVDEQGKALWRGKCASTPEAIAAVVNVRAPHVERIGLESGPLSAWHWHELKKRGLPVICLDARHAKAALSLQVNKTDPNDALGLAQIVHTGWYREGTVKSLDSQVIRSFLSSRACLVEVRVDLFNQIQGMLKPFGLVAGKGGRQPFIDRVRELVADGPLKDAVEALLAALQEVSRQIGILSRRPMGLARQDQAARRLMTAPGIGSLVALAYISGIDTPDRFSSSSSVGAYLGLTPLTLA